MTNRLRDSSSPYLRQHANNPVDWHPWDAQALALARTTGKPILLSIGYSACHWCHVMAHESFEDPVIAALMNQHFINIKVDREERPDLDKIYQLAQQVLTRHTGGWPLTMFLTHDTQQPFFGGTYFPPAPRHGLPGFGDLLTRVAAYYGEHFHDIEVQRQALQNVFDDLTPAPALTEVLDDSPMQLARTMLDEQLDGEFGGFSGAPKFPPSRTIEFLLQHWRRSHGAATPDLNALYMAALTLTRMSEGGLQDQVGGGFYRYSVDRYWMIPHFEKMLYDNAELLRVFAQAALATGDALFARTARATARWLVSQLQSPLGAFYSSWDADSEGHEGRYYVWDAAHVVRLLPAEQYAVLARRYGLDQAPNFEGRWHLHSYRSIDDIGAELGLDADAVSALLSAASDTLLQARQERVRPALDDKILTSWNALAISALAQAGRALDDPALTATAIAAMDAIQHQLWRDGRLYAVHAQGQSLYPAYLDDHAYLLDACVELLQSQWRDADLTLAQALAERLLTHFADPRGGFFFTADDHETLIHRSKPLADEAIPAGNALAARALQRLGYLLGEPRYIQAAEGCLRAVWPVLQQHPVGHCSWMTALAEYLAPPQLIIIRSHDAEALQWQRSLNRVYQPHRLVFVVPPEAVLPAALRDKAVGARPVAYVCTGLTCGEPLTSLEALIAVSR